MKRYLNGPPEDPWADLKEEAERWRGATMEEHGAAIADLMHLAEASIAGSPIGDRLREYQVPRSAEAEALWLRLVKAYRAQ